MHKNELRKLYKEKRYVLSEQSFLKFSDLLLIQFQGANFKIPGIVFSYKPLENHGEFDPYYIEEYCRFKNPIIQFAYPVIDISDSSMKAILGKNDAPFEVNNYGIPEPVSGKELPGNAIEMVFVPLLYADASGNRVGYGKGYYDRFLAEVQPETIKIGFSFFEPDEVITDVSEYDIPLHFLITPNRVYQF